MASPRITVLMPVYNAERFLREAIDSILEQSFKPFEFLIIDDGSTDGSAAIVESYRDPRIRFIRNERNLGITETLNKGILLASCELIARMDADDVSHPQRLQKQFGYMRRNPTCALLSTWARVISEEGQLIRLERYRSNFYYYNLTFECWIYHPTVMFCKSAVVKAGMYAMLYSEDYDLFWRMSTAFKIGNLPEALVDYRLSPTSLNTVLKRKEYAIANEQNVLRNLRYYLGNTLCISRESLECLRHNFEPILHRYSLKAVQDALGVMDAVTGKMIEKENVNRDVRSIRHARYFKRRFMLKEIANGLPFHSAVDLLMRTGAWITLVELVKHIVKGSVKRWLNTLRGSASIPDKILTQHAIKNS